MSESPISCADLLACAIETARTAGTHALENAARRRDVISTDRHDVKLKLDVECQQLAERVIRGAYPAHAFLGEEETGATHDATDADYLWIVDPIDGTVNFAHALPVWCCSVAVQHRDRIVAGAVYAPAMDHLYTAGLEEPAREDGREIRVSDVPSLDAGIVMTGMDRFPDPDVPPLTYLSRIAEACQRTRILGSAAYDICQVAAGRGDGYFESAIFTWDVAAAGLIVRRAGGRTELLQHMDKPHKICYMASNGLVHEELKSAMGY